MLGAGVAEPPRGEGAAARCRSLTNGGAVCDKGGADYCMH